MSNNKQIEAGPVPASAVPWRRSGRWGLWIVAGTAPGGELVADGDTGTRTWTEKRGDLLALVHRVNNWDALLAERDALRAERAEADAMESAVLLAKVQAERDDEHLRAERATQAERERCAAVVRAWAAHYPEDLFPDDGPSRDAIAGRALRLMLPAVAAALLEPDEESAVNGAAGKP